MISIEIHIGKKTANNKKKEPGPLKRAFRRLPHSVLAVMVVTLGLTVGFASVAGATNGKALLLGLTNDATDPTALVKTGPGPALYLRVDSGPALAVNSAAKVDNLNADMLDGKHASELAVGEAGVATDADMVDGKHANEFLGASARAADSDLLDGKDSTAFADAVHQHSGADITSGKVGAMFIDDAITTDGEAHGTYATKAALVTETQIRTLEDKQLMADLGSIDPAGPNDPYDLVDWSRLKGVPSGFADGTDDVGGGSTLADADTLDGKHAADLTRVARMHSPVFAYLTNNPTAYGEPLSITAPSDGFVVLTGNVHVDNRSTEPSDVYVRGYLQHTQTGAISPAVFTSLPSDPASVYTVYGQLSFNWVFPVNPGVNTFEILLHKGGPIGRNILVGHSNLSAIYIPYGPTGTGELHPTATQP
jgi:hypothetical protein